MKRPTIQQRERAVHKVAAKVADATWVVANAIEAVTRRIGRIGDVVNEVGHKVLGVAIWYSERHQEIPPYPSLQIKKLPPESLLHQLGNLHPLTLTNPRWPLDVTSVKRIFVQKQGGLVEEHEIPITNAAEGKIDLSVVATLSIGTYDLILEYENGMRETLSSPIEVVPFSKLNVKQRKG